MLMNFDELKAIGALVGDEPIKRAIKFTLDGQEYDATIWVKRLCVGDRDRMAALSASDDQRSTSALLISELVTLGEDGSERISFKDAYRLAPPLGDAIVEALRGAQ